MNITEEYSNLKKKMIEDAEREYRKKMDAIETLFGGNGQVDIPLKKVYHIHRYADIKKGDLKKVTVEFVEQISGEFKTKDITKYVKKHHKGVYRRFKKYMASSIYGHLMEMKDEGGITISKLEGKRSVIWRKVEKA